MDPHQSRYQATILRLCVDRNMQKTEDGIIGLFWSCLREMRTLAYNMEGGMRIWLKGPMFHLDPAKAGLKLNVSRGPLSKEKKICWHWLFVCETVL